jgi:hypothetical protein
VKLWTEKLNPSRIPTGPARPSALHQFQSLISAALPSGGFSQKASQLITQCYIFINHSKSTLNIFRCSKMDTASEAERALEMEAMRKEDSSWHPCQVSFRWGLRCSLCFPLQFGSRIIVNTKFNIQRIVLCCFFFSLRSRDSLWKLIA